MGKNLSLGTESPAVHLPPPPVGPEPGQTPWVVTGFSPLTHLWPEVRESLFVSNLKSQ